MQAVTAFDHVCAAARKVGGAVARTFSMVDPDVWREFACVGACSYSLLLPRREEVKDRPANADHAAPVVLVHGLGANRGTWTPLRLFLRLNGYRRVYAFGYEKGSIEEHGRALAKFIDDVREATGEAQVDIVAHSLGGVIARYAIQRAGAADDVRTLITLASPHQGTHAARYANTPLTVALRPDSAVIRDLAKDDLSTLPLRFVALSADRDVYVVPETMMHHPDAENVRITGIGHTEQILSPRVFRLVDRVLSGQPVPQTVECDRSS